MHVNHRLPSVGAVLAGGQSRRMGRPKEGVRLTGSTLMIEPVLRALRECCSTVFVLGACDGYDLSNWPIAAHLRDLRSGLGPLSGIETLLASGFAEGYLVVACDQPAVTVPLLSRLAGGDTGRFFQRPGEQRVQPLPGYYPASWLLATRAAINEGRRSLRALVDSHEVERVPLAPSEERLLRSLNTPEDVEAFREGAA